MELKDNAIKSWANKFPFGFKEFVKGMDNENRIAIASVLIEKDELRFSELQEILNLQKNLLSQHLKILLKYGIIRRTKSKWEENEKVLKSKYKLNPKYRKLICMNINQLKKPLLKDTPKIITPTIFPSVSEEESFPNIGIVINKKYKTIEGVVKYKGKNWFKSKKIGEKDKWIIKNQTKKM